MIFMVLQILLNHLIRHVAGTECPIAYSPEMLSPVTFTKLREFLLDFSGASPFHEADHLADREFRGIGDIDMDVVFAYPSPDNLNIIGVTDLTDQLPHPETYLFCQHVIPILRYPYQMDFQIVNCINTLVKQGNRDFRIA